MDKKAKVADFLVMNGWIVISLAVLLISMAYLGVFDSFWSSKYKCNLGDGLVCSGFIAGFENSSGHIDLVAENDYGTDIINMTFLIQGCDASTLLERTPYEKSSHISVDGCSGMVESSDFVSSIEVIFVTLDDGRYILHKNRGYISVNVPAQNHESLWAKLMNKIVPVIRRNVG